MSKIKTFVLLSFLLSVTGLVLFLSLEVPVPDEVIVEEVSLDSFSR